MNPEHQENAATATTTERGEIRHEDRHGEGEGEDRLEGSAF